MDKAEVQARLEKSIEQNRLLYAVTALLNENVSLTVILELINESIIPENKRKRSVVVRFNDLELAAFILSRLTFSELRQLVSFPADELTDPVIKNAAIRLYEILDNPLRLALFRNLNHELDIARVIKNPVQLTYLSNGSNFNPVIDRPSPKKR